MTLKYLIEILKEYSLLQPNVNSFSEGDIYDALNANPQVKYSTIHVTQTNYVETESTTTYNLSIFYVDRLLDDNSNKLQIQSTGKELISNILKSITETFNDEVDDVNNITFQPFTERFNDACAGVYANVAITTIKETNCAEQYDGWVSPNVIIINQDILIEENGIYLPDKGYTGFGKVEVNVPQGEDYEEGYNKGFNQGKTEGIEEGKEEGYQEGREYQKTLLESITITQNGTYDNENGYDVIEVNVPTQGGDCEGVYEQGKEEGYNQGKEEGIAQGKEEQKSLLEDLNVSENGTYQSENGYKQVVVNVPNQGGDYEEGYNQGKQDGKEEGYQEGKTEGKEEGFNEGYDSGFSTGYTDGHSQGKEDQKALLEDLNITQNGTYTNENGYKEVVVNVPQGGDCEGVYEQGKEEGYNQGKQDIIDSAETLYVTENGTYSIERTITGYYDDGTPFYDYAKVNNLVFPTGIQVSPDTEVEVWFKTTQYDFNEGIVASQNGENLGAIFKLVEGEGHFTGEIGGQQPNIFDMEGAKLETNKWYHLKMSYNNGLWVNGKQVGTYEASSNVVPPYFEVFINGYSNQEAHSDTGVENYFGMVKINGQIFIPKEDTFWNITEGYGLNQSTMGENPYYEFIKDTGENVLQNLIKEVIVNVPNQGGDCEGVYEEGYNQGKTEGIEEGKEEGKKDAIKDADTLSVTKNGTYSIREITGYYDDGTPFYDYAKLNNMAFGTGVQVSTDTEVELWFKTGSYSTNGAIIGSQRQDNINAIFKLTKGEGHFTGEIGGQQPNIFDMEGAKLETNKWYHLKMSYRDGLWVNGKQVGTFSEDRNVTEPYFELFINGISNMNEWYDNTGIENYFGMVKINGQTFIPKENGFWNVTNEEGLSTFTENENAYYEFTKVSEENLFENLLKEVVVNIDTQSYYSQGFNEGYEIGFGQGKEEQRGLLKTITITKNGQFINENGYREIIVNVPTTKPSEEEELLPYVLFENEDRDIKLKYVTDGTLSPYFEYSFDGINFIQWDYSEISGRRIYLRGVNNTRISDENNYLYAIQHRIVESPYTQFPCLDVTISGNIMALVNGVNVRRAIPEYSTITDDYMFAYLFKGFNAKDENEDNDNIWATNLKLPATTLTIGCYKGMFANTPLKIAPYILPAKALKTYCYESMFENTLIVSSPILMGETLVNYCYKKMFYNCYDLYKVYCFNKDWEILASDNTSICEQYHKDTEYFMTNAGAHQDRGFFYVIDNYYVWTNQLSNDACGFDTTKWVAVPLDLQALYGLQEYYG